MPQSLLRIEGLRTYFHTQAAVIRAVDGVDLGIEKGRTLGVVGESGCSKSVTALSIMRLIDAREPEILSRGATSSSLRRRSSVASGTGLPHVGPALDRSFVAPMYVNASTTL
jgi:ABC-type dipeptide/oligopeptide/nickel transport system ATPase component